LKPAPKNKDIRDFQSELLGKDITQSIEEDVCVQCGEPASLFRDEISAHEFSLSGLCQKCQDDFFVEDGEDDE